MTTYQEELMAYLPGLTEDMPDPFFHLAEIMQCGVLEITRGKESNHVLIPYMMNDAIEYYLEMEVTSIEGDFVPEEEIVSRELRREASGYKLELYQAGGTWTLIGFRSLCEHARLYRYHEIGHFWVKGMEQWRRLVYMVAIVNDKYAYFGDQFCNEVEMMIKDLMGFGPFRSFSPISETLDQYYEDTEEGLLLMTDLARQAGDTEFVNLLKVYRKHPGNAMMAGMVKDAMIRPERYRLFCLIRKVIEAGSESYAARAYPEKTEEKIDLLRMKTRSKLKAMGFEGDYPYFQKGDTCVFAAEEHPFTVMESRDFCFKIRLMTYDQNDFMDCAITDMEGNDPYKDRWEDV